MLEPTAQDILENERRPAPRQIIALSRAEMERRRLDAGEDLLHGNSHTQVVVKFGVSRTTASRWHRALTANGLESLRKARASGRPSRLTPGQKAEIADMFQKDILSLGVAENHWSAKLLARIIEERFSVHYSLEHVARLLHKLRPVRNVEGRSQGQADEQTVSIARH